LVLSVLKMMRAIDVRTLIDFGGIAICMLVLIRCRQLEKIKKKRGGTNGR
jgi:hypothetical protein